MIFSAQYGDLLGYGALYCSSGLGLLVGFWTELGLRCTEEGGREVSEIIDWKGWGLSEVASGGDSYVAGLWVGGGPSSASSLGGVEILSDGVSLMRGSFRASSVRGVWDRDVVACFFCGFAGTARGFLSWGVVLFVWVGFVCGVVVRVGFR